jgi:hypothetical protein
MTSRHHRNMVRSTPRKPRMTIHGVEPCIQTTAPMAMMKAETEPTNGQGLGSTRW